MASNTPLTEGIFSKSIGVGSLFGYIPTGVAFMITSMSLIS